MAWLLLLAAALAVAVIPAVWTDTFVHAAPRRAALALGVVAAIDVSIGALLWLLAGRARALGRMLSFGLALVSAGLAAALVDAGSAFAGHGIAMRVTSVLLFACAAVHAATALALGLAARGGARAP